ncbi:MAG: hypothetical protein ACI9MR_003646 [Myxococcota bacterium]|jgi:hypothetical protein
MDCEADEFGTREDGAGCSCSCSCGMWSGNMCDFMAEQEGCEFNMGGTWNACMCEL